MGKISGSHCLVMGCRNRQLLNQTNSRSYFRFPRDPDMCKQWVDFCNRPELWKKYDENGPEYLYKSSRICSDHFQSSDFNNPNLFSQGLKKGSVPTLYPASKEPKNRYSIGAISGVSGIGLMGGSVAGGGGGSSSPPTNNSNSNHSDSDSLALPMPTTKRPLLSQPSAQQPVAKQRRSVPPALSTAAINPASVSGALAGLIQRQLLKEQQRKAMASALQLHQRQHAQTQQAGRSLLESLKLRPNPNNNNNHISSIINNNNNNNHSNNNNNNNNNSKNKSAAASPGKYEDEQGYGINYVDMDGGDSSEYDSSYQNSEQMDEEISQAYKHMQQMKAIKAAAAVIPASLQGELTVTPAVIHTSSSTGNNNNHSNAKSSSNSVSTSSSCSTTNGTINYKEKYEQTLKELFACRKIVKNQNNAIRQLQTEIDFLTQLLKEK